MMISNCFSNFNRMDFFKCNICCVSYDEDIYQPRNPPCGHGICTTCVRALIKDSFFKCPTCRGMHQVKVPEDLQVNFKLMEVISEFKGKCISLAESKVSGAANYNLRNVHSAPIRHWCSSCQMWFCNDCYESHIELLDCYSRSAAKPMIDIQKENINSIDTMLLTSAEEDATDMRNEHLKMIEKHGEEIKKLTQLVQQMKNAKKKLDDSKKELIAANSPYAVTECIKVVIERKESLRTWSELSKVY